MGYVIGTYYDHEGRPTAALRKAKLQINAGQKEQEGEDEQKRKTPPCNSRWTKENGGEVWCSTLSGGVERNWEGVPRQFHKVGGIPEDPKCVCVRTPEEAAENPNMRIYSGCNPTSTRCKI